MCEERTSFENLDIISRKCGYNALFVDIMEGLPEWLSVVPEPAASRRRRWSEMSSALRTNSGRWPLVITSRYRWTARRISSTSVFQVSGTACASSKNLRGNNEVLEALAGALAKEFMVVPTGGIPCCIAESDMLLASVRFVRERLIGDAALKESMDVAGDTPSDRYDRLRRC